MSSKHFGRLACQFKSFKAESSVNLLRSTCRDDFDFKLFGRQLALHYREIRGIEALLVGVDINEQRALLCAANGGSGRKRGTIGDGWHKGDQRSTDAKLQASPSERALARRDGGCGSCVSIGSAAMLAEMNDGVARNSADVAIDNVEAVIGKARAGRIQPPMIPVALARRTSQIHLPSKQTPA